MTTSPLTSASPDAITALFEADPVNNTDAQLTSLIHELQRRRSVFLSEEAAKSLAPKKTRAKAEPSTDAPALDKPVSEVSLDDL